MKLLRIFLDVVGLRENVFWLTHDNLEEGGQTDMHQRSHSNLWEVDIIHALLRRKFAIPSFSFILFHFCAVPKA